MPTPYALLLLALLDATPGLAAAQPHRGELSPREEFMVMVGVGSGYMSALCNLEKDGFISTATRAKPSHGQHQRGHRCERRVACATCAA